MARGFVRVGAAPPRDIMLPCLVVMLSADGALVAGQGHAEGMLFSKRRRCDIWQCRWNQRRMDINMTVRPGPNQSNSATRSAQEEAAAIFSAGGEALLAP